MLHEPAVRLQPCCDKTCHAAVFVSQNVRIDCYLVLVMSNPTRRRATYQDVLDAPRHKVAEIIHGDLYLFSRPRVGHSSVGGALHAQLLLPFGYGSGGPGNWILLMEPELHLGDDILVPDIAGWRCERLPVVEDVAYTTLAPDWVCEVLSKSTEKVDRIDKMPSYAAAGVKHAWLVHPIRRTLEVFRRRARTWRTVAIHRDDQRARIEPFEALDLDLSFLWHKLATPGPRRDRASEPTAIYQVRHSR
jgi:Uma2 family endonuclease